METDDSTIDPLIRFHPVISQWFRDQYNQPTDIQDRAWRRIQAKQHVLVTAPTVSGKTLTAFLWAINQLTTASMPLGHTAVLYVSPLKALNNDIQRNLLQPLDELKTCFRRAGEDLPNIRVLTRSGDTPFAERRHMLRRPPEILITTPESLNLLLASPRARAILRTVQTLILDEIHAVFDGKRGTYLMTAVERLVLLAGEFQRIALSATVNPLQTVADVVGGYRLRGSPGTPEYIKRNIEIISSRSGKTYDIRVRYPVQAASRPSRESIWDALVTAFKTKIGQNRSTLLFVNNRRLCEKIALKLNRGESEPLAYAHHGSLSRELRETVESRLKAGRLKAIVATNSLELGIDIGPLDEVFLVQSPPSLSAAIQRIGRSGHQVGQVSRGSLYPTHARDFLEAAVLAQHLPEQAIEPKQPVHAPLDVLAQVIVAMTGVDTWDVDELYLHLRASYAYRDLSRKQFDLVLQMLAGKYAMSRLRDLKPRVAIDGLKNTVKARRGPCRPSICPAVLFPTGDITSSAMPIPAPASANWTKNSYGKPGWVRPLTWGPRSGASKKLPPARYWLSPAIPRRWRRPSGKGKRFNGTGIFRRKSSSFWRNPTGFYRTRPGRNRCSSAVTWNLPPAMPSLIS